MTGCSPLKVYFRVTYLVRSPSEVCASSLLGNGQVAFALLQPGVRVCAIGYCCHVYSSASCNAPYSQVPGSYSSLCCPSWLTELGIKGILMRADGVRRFTKAALITSTKCEQQQNLPLCLVKKLAEQVLHMSWRNSVSRLPRMENAFSSRL